MVDENIGNDMKAFIRAVQEDTRLIEWTENLLLKLCNVPSFIQTDVTALRKSEEDCYRIIKEESDLFAGDSHEFRYCPIHREIEVDEYFTNPNYSIQDNIYEGRNNVLLIPRGTSDYNWFFNSHIDVVPPYYPATASNGIVNGRGTNDNKGGVVTSLLLLKILAKWKAESGVDLRKKIALSFSIDEEIGGNGSLSMIKDVTLKGKSVVVLEPTKLVPFPANRGALWFKIETQGSPNQDVKYSYLATFCLIVKLVELTIHLRENHGHRLFKDDDIQLCIGILNDYGKFPASACSEYRFFVHKSAYPDKTILTNELNQVLMTNPMLNKFTSIVHGPEQLKINEMEHGWEICVFSLSGHMGSKVRGADAVVKASFLIQHLSNLSSDSVDWEENRSLVIVEGGQGFLPSLKIGTIRQMIEKACTEVKNERSSEYSSAGNDIEIRVSFDKIHNEAYCSRDNAPGVNAIVDALEGIGQGLSKGSLSGWQASCDARIFARDSDDVTTFGAGALEDAHGPDEFVRTNDLIKAACTLFLAVNNHN